MYLELRFHNDLLPSGNSELKPHLREHKDNDIMVACHVRSPIVMSPVVLACYPWGKHNHKGLGKYTLYVFL